PCGRPVRRRALCVRIRRLRRGGRRVALVGSQTGAEAEQLSREQERQMQQVEGEYAPSAWDWVRQQVETYERTGGREANTLRDTGLPIIIVTTRGNKSGKVRKMALMRVEHDGQYALVASMGGAPKHPVWYRNLKANPSQ